MTPLRSVEELVALSLARVIKAINLLLLAPATGWPTARRDGRSRRGRGDRPDICGGEIAFDGGSHRNTVHPALWLAAGQIGRVSDHAARLYGRSATIIAADERGMQLHHPALPQSSRNPTGPIRSCPLRGAG